jgi:leader peptidase (prepilin peptidase) / N-methyltransferase
VFAVWCLVLAVYDVRTLRLPNWGTLPGAAAVLGYAAALGRAEAALVGAGMLAGLYLAVHLAAPRSFGAGDVKLALGLGGAAALGGAHAWLAAAVLAPAVTALVGLVVRRRLVPHGPAMCAATLLALGGFV